MITAEIYQLVDCVGMPYNNFINNNPHISFCTAATFVCIYVGKPLLSVCI
jgi:hypothetical protein